MEDEAEDNLDGSSIKPVSSLRSHFEQMAKPTLRPAGIAPPRPISPKPNIQEHNLMSSPSPLGVTNQDRSRPSGLTNLAPHLSTAHQRPSSADRASSLPFSAALAIEPSSSPAMALDVNIALPLYPSSFTNNDTKSSSTTGTSSPRHFRIPSRPHTPLLDLRRSPSLSFSQPPDPPPRSSGESRRDASSKAPMGPPPPVNRAEKPKIPSKQLVLGTATLVPISSSRQTKDRVSPFSTPPSSDSSPERNDPLPAYTRRSEILTERPGRPQAPVISFDPPPAPVHRSVINRKNGHELFEVGNSMIVPKGPSDLRDQKFPLPPRYLGSTSYSPTQGLLQKSNNFQETLRIPKDTLTSRPIDHDQSFPIPPKRNLPAATQSQTLSRNGRLMTADQANGRAPRESQPAGKLVSESTGNCIGPDIEYHNPAPEFIFNPAEYPDSSLSNRRPPYIKEGPRDIPTKYDTRVFDSCGEFICTSGHYTKIWNLRNGQQVLNLPHGESIKVLSASFKPAANPQDEGSRLWLGNNFGELLEISTSSPNPIVATNNTAHMRREVIRIYRYQNEMWTLDDGGTLHIWTQDSTGSLTLDGPTISFRVPKGHTFSIIVGRRLWYATGSDIRVFMPTLDATVQFQVLQRPLSCPGVGDVTSGAVIINQPDRVYFGHADGKVSIYSHRNYSCLGIVNVSIYKINSLTGVGNFLWAAYNTGMIYIYDPTQVPWLVKKDWRAHENPVINVLADKCSFWMLERLQVVSLGADNVLRLWDGLLQDDWLEKEIQSNEERFCSFEQIKTLVMTWNVGAATPRTLRYSEQDKAFFPDLLKESNLPDILVFGFQELVDLEDTKTTAKSLFSKSRNKDPSDQEHMKHQYRDWRDYLVRCLDDCMPRNELYHLLYSSSLVGLFTCVFVRARLRDRIKNVSGAEVKRGMGGRAGNKGAVVLRFMVDDTSLCFVNCHLAAGQTQTKDRNFDISEILDSSLLTIEKDLRARYDSYAGGGDGSMILDHEICVLNGDLNYRIDTMSRDAVITALKSRNIDRLLERDQLLVSRRRRPGFRLRTFSEMPITFAPTYKYDVGTDNYDSSEKKRAPAWCDRILYRSWNRTRVKQLDYRRHEVRVSDHRPVTGIFCMTVKAISPKKRDAVWEECKQRFEEARKKLAFETKWT